MHENLDKAVTAMSFGEIEAEYLQDYTLNLAQLQQTIEPDMEFKEAECRDKVFVKRERKIAVCERKNKDNPDGKKVCIGKMQKWVDR
jgi:hypothetical protein